MYIHTYIYIAESLCWTPKTNMALQIKYTSIKLKNVKVKKQTPEYIHNYKKWYKVLVNGTKSCPTLCDPMDYTVHGILQARILEWVAFSFSRGSSQPRIQPRSPALQADSLPAEPQGKPKNTGVVAYPFSRGSSQSRNRTGVSCIAGEFFTNWSIKEAHKVLSAIKEIIRRNSLAVWWLGLCTFSAESLGSIASQRTKITHTHTHAQKFKESTRETNRIKKLLLLVWRALLWLTEAGRYSEDNLLNSLPPNDLN